MKHKKKRKNEVFIPEPENKITDHHHIIPRSRNGGKDSNNYVEVNKELHRRYHDLFGNMRPDEIICYLVKEFWGNQSGWIQKGFLLWKAKRGDR